MLEHERWDRVFSATRIKVPWQLRTEQRKLLRLVVLVAEADQGVATLIVIPLGRRRYATKRDVVKYQGSHDDRCPDRSGEVTAEDAAQR